MRKLFTLLMGLSLMFTSCKSGGSKEKSADKAEAVKVGFIYIGHVGDGGWTYSHNEGRKFVEKELGVETMFVEAVPEGPEVQDRMRELIDAGCNLVVANSFGYMDYMESLSSEYPEVKFLHCSGFKTTDNMGNYFGRVYQARYLTGVVAGMKTKSNKIGYVAAFEIPEVVRGINAFTLGARSVNPEAVVEVVWTKTWYDPTVEKQAAIAMLDNGCDVIAQHQDTTEPQKAAEERGAFAVGYHTDMQAFAPKANMVSAVWNWGPYYKAQIESIQNKSWKPGAYWGGMKEGVVDITALSEVAPEGAAAKVAEIKNQILNGEFAVFQGPINDHEGNEIVAEGVKVEDKDLLSMSFFVEGVVPNN